METMLIELKARLSSLISTRKKIITLGGVVEGVFHQTDTYFNTSHGRLKIREIKNQSVSRLIYYEREDIPKLKKSDVVLYDTKDPDDLKLILDSAFGIKVIVKKKREIYNIEGTQIHLDLVKGLGIFIEFERPITNLPDDEKVLQGLMEELNIMKEDLLTYSYSDMLLGNSYSHGEI